MNDVKLRCPICKMHTSGVNSVYHHLMPMHDMDVRRAKFLAQKLIDWRLQSQDLLDSLKQTTMKRGFDISKEVH
jgi:hypothetical protein